MNKYVIRRISALSIIAAARENGGNVSFYLDATDPSREYLVDETRQDDCPMFHQAMCALYGRGFRDEAVSEKLKDAVVYIDFTGTFDRKQRAGSNVIGMAERMLGPDGIEFFFGNDRSRYIAFERSASMSRSSVLSFVRADLYEPLCERIMLGMKIEKCQLSKLYAYNGLMYTSGRRVEGSDLLSGRKVIVIDNPKSIVKNAEIITVEDDGSDLSVRKYHRVEKRADVGVLEFDGEGIISKELAKRLDPSGTHHSFQIRLPYIKGVVHEVDFKKLFADLGVGTVKDLWGVEHRTADVDMILTKSMFKGFGWMTENGLSWNGYLDRCLKYDHALYISGTDKAERQGMTELNYQFLNTLALTEDEFRPKDLPLGWSSSPKNDPRRWLTKTTETAYYSLVSDGDERRDHYLNEIESGELGYADRRRQRAELVKKNPLFLEESIFARELADRAERIRKKYALGQLLVSGDNRYLSDDLIRLLAHIVKASVGENGAYRRLWKETLEGNEVYAPSPAYEEQENYTLLRSPHIARNEEALVFPLPKVGPIRRKYLSHLYYVLMVDSRSLIPERLGGADYDGDMVKTIADPLVNGCVMRESEETPVLKIPAAEPLISDANDWDARVRTVRSTFSSRVGRISNAALRRGIIAYDENNDDDERDMSREDTETLAILTGLEIDSAKSGVKPDLDEYLVERKAKKSLFLKYKAIVDEGSERKWYEPTVEKQVGAFIENTDWDGVSSNLELLPYYAYMLGKETVKHKPVPAGDEQLFVFASDPDWRDHIDPSSMERMKKIISAYHAAHERIMTAKHISADMKRRADIERILFSQGRLGEHSADELYALLDGVSPEGLRKARLMLTERSWHLTPKDERRLVLYDILPGFLPDRFTELFCDFRCGGYRLLGDIICDMDDIQRANAVSKHLIRKDDCRELQFLLEGAKKSADFRQEIVRRCVFLLSPPDRREKRIDFGEAVKCAAALGERQFALEVFPIAVLEVARSEKIGKKKRGLFGI